VSVCVATYNRAKLLRERCVASVLAQTYSNLELVIIGDGCTDETTDVMRAVGDARITFRNRPERGRYPEDPQKRWMVAGTYAVNEALALASGYFITHLDDDDEYTPDRLELLVRFCKENQADFVWHPFWRETVDGTWALNEAESFRHSRLTTSSVFYRSWFKRIGWDINAYRLAEPGDWNRFRKIKYVGGVSIRYPKPLLYHYREGSQLAAHPGSKS
jgi:glycosyltransferase involved in cell wall biosynthesis